MNQHKNIIEGDRRLSQSLLWQIQRLYFERSGMAAWRDDVVPHSISSNPVMARAYSRVVWGYLRDCAAAAQAGDMALDPAQPIYIVELGAGSGRLAHHFLHQFHDRQANGTLAGLTVKYVMTDFVPQIVEFWQQQEKLQRWVDAGLLDFALFDVTDKRLLSLRHANLTLTPDRFANPPILIANYFFDSIPQDSFVIEDGQLCENLLTLYSTQPEPNLADPTIWERLSLAYEAIPLQKSYYDVPIYDRILDDYEAQLPDTTLTFPNVGLDCVRFWQGVGNGRILLLTSDRGLTLADSLIGQEDPLPNLHGSFSLMVNYHAIGEYVARDGGLALHSPHYQDNLQVAAYLLGDVPQGGIEIQQAFADAVVNGGPDDLFALRQALMPHLDELTLPQLLSVLRLSTWDADVLRDCHAALLAQVQQSDPVWYADVAAVLTHVWRQYLPLNEDDDLKKLITQLFDVMGATFSV